MGPHGFLDLRIGVGHMKMGMSETFPQRIAVEFATVRGRRGRRITELRIVGELTDPIDEDMVATYELVQVTKRKMVLHEEAVKEQS